MMSKVNLSSFSLYSVIVLNINGDELSLYLGFFLLSHRSLVRKNFLKISGSDFVVSRFNMIRKHYESVIHLTRFRSDSLPDVLLLHKFRSNQNRLYFYFILFIVLTIFMLLFYIIFVQSRLPYEIIVK